MGPVKAQGQNLKNTGKPRVGVIMGSASDLQVMKEAAAALKEFGIAFELTVVSAHRTPELMVRYGRDAKRRGLEVIIAGAGGAAHLPGMVAAVTTLPVVGVPVLSRISLAGVDSLLSIVQMPPGVPVATVAVNGAYNAGVLAAQILGLADKAVSRKLDAHKEALRRKARLMAGEVSKQMERAKTP